MSFIKKEQPEKTVSTDVVDTVKLLVLEQEDNLGKIVITPISVNMTTSPVVVPALSIAKKGKLSIEIDPDYNRTIESVMGSEYKDESKRKEFILSLKKLRYSPPCIKHELNLNEPSERLQYLVYRNSSLFIKKGDSVYTGGLNPPLFIISDEDKDLDNTIEKASVLADAYNILTNMSPDEKRKFARCIGERNVVNIIDKKIQVCLIDYMNKTPEKFISLAKSLLRKEMELFYALIDERIILRENGVFKYGEVMLGVTEDECFQFFRLPINRDIINTLKKQVNFL